MRTQKRKQTVLPPSKAELRMAIRLRQVGLKAMQKLGGDPSTLPFEAIDKYKQAGWIAVVRHIQKWKARS